VRDSCLRPHVATAVTSTVLRAARAPHFLRASTAGPGNSRSVVDSISEKDYQARAFPALSALIAALDEHPDELFAELAGDVLTIEFDDQSRYIINSHLAARQIWLAADRNAWHFDFVAERGLWVDRKSQAELWSKLEELLQHKRGHRVPLKRAPSSA
jgi:iron-sulfur cluster assembly protein CyaY